MRREPLLDAVAAVAPARGRDAAAPLAIDGGRAVREQPWPAWPRVTRRTEQALLGAVRSGRWTVSGAFTGEEPCERRFAGRFADYIGVEHCVPTCHGSSALLIALEALGIGPGSEVLVPGLTWVACASAVARAGATPILVDVDADTLCMSAQAAEAAITPRTAAIMVVHLFCSAADLDAFVALSERHSIALLEDCSQAHGARWRGRRLGSYGTIAAFSFQQTKLLTSGEGGAALTADPELYDRMQQLRADGRRYVSRPRVGHLDLEEVGMLQGHNYCLSELHAALLLDGLDRLDAENRTRRLRASELAELLEDVDGVRLQGQPEGLEDRTFYHLCLRIDRGAFGDRDVDWVAEALQAELGLPGIEPVDRPLNDNPLYDPLRSPRTAPQRRRELDPARFDLPAATHARRTCLTIPHRALLASSGEMGDIAHALAKIQRHAAAGRGPLTSHA